MNSIEHLELIELVFDRIEQNPLMQESFRFVGFTPEGIAHTFYLHSLEDQEERGLLLRCLQNSITFKMIDDFIREWIEIYNYYLVLHEVWEKIKTGNLDMDAAPGLIKMNIREWFQSRDKFLGTKSKYKDFGLEGSLGIIHMFEHQHDELSCDDLFWPECKCKELQETDDNDSPDTNYEKLVANLIEFIAALIGIKKHHWRLRKRALQDLLDGKKMEIDIDQVRLVIQDLESHSKIEKYPLWLRTALTEKILIDSGKEYFYLKKDNVRIFWKELLDEIQNEYPVNVAVDKMPTLKQAQELIKRENGDDYSYETFKKAKHKAMKEIG